MAPHNNVVTLTDTDQNVVVDLCFLIRLCHKFTFHLYVLVQGSDIFAAKINIEVQRASEGAIAAIERNGGIITTSFYDPLSLGNK